MEPLAGPDPDCPCLSTPQAFDGYREVRFVGVDEAGGRFGQVWVRQCRRCGRHWLHYAVEYEHEPESGRYFMGLIAPEAAAVLTPAQALAHLDARGWHLYGGSYFRGQGRAEGRVSPLA